MGGKGTYGLDQIQSERIDLRRWLPCGAGGGDAVDVKKGLQTSCLIWANPVGELIHGRHRTTGVRP